MSWNDRIGMPNNQKKIILYNYYAFFARYYGIHDSKFNFKLYSVYKIIIFVFKLCTWCTDVRKYIVEDRVMKNRVTSFLKENLYSVCVGFEAWFQRTELIFKFNTWNLFKVNFCSKFGFSQHKSVSYSLGRKPQL